MCICIYVSVSTLVVVLVLFITSTAAATLEASALSGGGWQARGRKGRGGTLQNNIIRFWVCIFIFGFN